MSTTALTPQHPATHGLAGVIAVAALCAALADLLHEFGHAAATLLPLGVRAVHLSTVGLSTVGSHPLVSLAGPLANLALALFLPLASAPKLPPAWRYFGWLFGTFNLFDATAYLMYSAILGSGDWASVFGAFSPASWWRPLVGIGGAALYAASVSASLLALRRLIGAGLLGTVEAERCCAVSWWTGGLLLTVGAVFNPVGPWLILTSGTATGFGAMAGILVLPMLLRRARPGDVPAARAWSISRGWIAAGYVASCVFVAVFGRGVPLAGG